ncbi:MAG: ATP-binding protein [Thermodesulfobacteriota bacterium]
MRFRDKLGLAASSILLLTLLVAMTGWWGMEHALQRQENSLAFTNFLDVNLQLLAREEQAAVLAEDLQPSRTVFSTLAALQRRLAEVRTASNDPAQQRIIANLIASLTQYEKHFAAYLEQQVAMQTMRSRMLNESRRLLANIATMPIAEDRDGAMNHLLGTVLQTEKEYLLGIEEVSEATMLDRVQQLVALAEKRSATAGSADMQLRLFRITRACSIYLTSFQSVVREEKLLRSSRNIMKQSLEQVKEDLLHYKKRETALTRRAGEQLKRISAGGALLALMLGLIGTMVLATRITLPLARLKESAEQIVAGNLDTAVQVGGNDEIGDLGRMFNLMTERLKETFASLARHHAELEDRILQRTAELRKEVAERSRAEKQAMDSEARFRAFFDNAADGILIADPESMRFLTGNKRISRMLGYGPEEISGLPISAIHPPEALPLVEAAFGRSAANDWNLAEDIPVLRKDGTIFPAEITAAWFTVHDKRYVLAIFRDRTEQKRTEEERLKLRKLESVGVLAGGIAHDFNNILTAVLGNTSLALLALDNKEELRRLLVEVEQASMRARGLTHQLLTFAKGGEPVKKISSMDEVIRDSANFVLRGSPVKAVFDFAADLRPVSIDPDQISQVVQNLVINARQAMVEGGVVRFHGYNLAADDPILAGLGCNHAIRVDINDTGCGIPEDLLGRIFDPYFTTKEQGSGLGLAICHSIIGKHGGRISVESTPGVGTTFHIVLPALAAAGASAKSQTAAVAPSAPRGRILFMDDEEMLQRMVAAMLARLGHQMTAAAGGKQAIDLYAEALAGGEPYSLVIMDLTIPGGMGGKEAVRKILELDSSARVVVASGYATDPIMANFRDYGFVDAINKPFGMAELQGLLQRLAGEEPLRQTGRD